MDNKLELNTIKDFGKQWQKFTENDGFYGSVDLFKDAFPLLNPADLLNKNVADIGSGSGRIVQMLLALGVAHVTAVEPSDAFDVLEKNLAKHHKKVTCLKISGEAFGFSNEFDYVVSYGVLHHIPNPVPVVHAAYEALKPGGKFCIWLYGKEGTVLYRSIVLPLRMITSGLPHSLLVLISSILYILLTIYGWLCRFLPLPLRDYMKEIVDKLSPADRKLVIYDQLNPSYAKYYNKAEVEQLMRDGGFKEIKLYHRHGYSWTALGVK
jgi:SAM-dependent methyltransferase